MELQHLHVLRDNVGCSAALLVPHQLVVCLNFNVLFIGLHPEIRIREMDNRRILYMLDAVEFSVCVQCDFT